MVRTTLVTMIGNFYMVGNFHLGIWPGTGSQVQPYFNPLLMKKYCMPDFLPEFK